LQRISCPEFEPIAIAVNRLLERLHRALDSERSFTANSAHELRTPLATALAKVQRLKTRISDETLQHNVAEIEESLRSLSVLSENCWNWRKRKAAARYHKARTI